MVANYTTVARVVRKLGWVDEDGNYPTPDSDTIPIDTEVTEEIENAESDLENYCKTAWREITVTEEYHSSPQRYQKWHTNGIPYQLNNRHVKDFDTNEGDKIEVWQGDQWLDLVANGNAGNGPYEGDYFLNGRDGIVYLYTNFPAFYQENTIRFTYRWGQSSVPNGIRNATTMLAAAFLIEAGFDWVFNLIDQDASLSNAEKAQKWEKRAYKIANRFKEMPPIPQY